MKKSTFHIDKRRKVLYYIKRRWCETEMYQMGV
jgi:hypothetical protein